MRPASPRGWAPRPRRTRAVRGWGAPASPKGEASQRRRPVTKHLCSRALRWGRGRGKRQVRGPGTVGAAAPLRPGSRAPWAPARRTFPSHRPQGGDNRPAGSAGCPWPSPGARLATGGAGCGETRRGPRAQRTRVVRAGEATRRGSAEAAACPGGRPRDGRQSRGALRSSAFIAPSRAKAAPQAPRSRTPLPPDPSPAAAAWPGCPGVLLSGRRRRPRS